MERTLILFWCHLVELSLLSCRTGFAISGRDRRRVFGWFRGPAFLFFSPFPPPSSPFLLLGPARVLFFPSARLLCRTASSTKAGPASNMPCLSSFSFVFSLPGLVPPSPLPPSLFFLSFFLSLFLCSLSCMHREALIDPVSSQTLVSKNKP